MSNSFSFRNLFRIGIFAPPDAVRGLLDAVQAIIPLGDERYDSVHWLLEGARERFRPLAGSRPTMGRIGELSDVESALLVIAIPRDEALLQQVLNDALLPSHPWESPSIFIDECRQPIPS